MRGRPKAACRVAPIRTQDIEVPEMPKMKTKSSAKKRFKVTATGKVKKDELAKLL